MLIPIYGKVFDQSAVVGPYNVCLFGTIAYCPVSVDIGGGDIYSIVIFEVRQNIFPGNTCFIRALIVDANGGRCRGGVDGITIDQRNAIVAGSGNQIAVGCVLNRGAAVGLIR